MTIGQRIALKRKELGLSQEALGEELGVSRQAIYKWESDGAVPEVEKLKQLARRFGVSVGWLLGVEEAESRESAAEESGELTEQQLRMVEEIVGRYIAAQPKPAKRKKKVYVLAALALLAVVWSLFTRLERLDDRYQDLQNSVSHMNSLVNSQIGSISSQVEEALEKQTLFTAEYGTELVEMDVVAETARFTAYAVPKTYVEGMTAEFVLESEGEVTTVLCTDAPQQKFSAELTCPLTDAMRISVIFVHPDGTRELQLLESYDYYLDMTYPYLYLDEYSLHGKALKEGKLSFEKDYFSIRSYEPGKGNVQVESVRVGVFVNRELVAWAEPCGIPQGWHGFEEHDFYCVSGVSVELSAEDQVQLAVLVRDSMGREFVQCDHPYAPGSADRLWPAEVEVFASRTEVSDWKFD